MSLRSRVRPPRTGPAGAGRRRGLRGRGLRRDARRAGSPPARRCSTPCCPATRRSSPTRRYAGQVIAFTYPHIGNYGVNADRRRGRRAALPRRGRARPGRRPVELALRGHARGLPGRPRGGRHHRRRHPAPHPAPARPRLGALRLRHGRRGRAGAAARGRAGHRRAGPRRRPSPAPTCPRGARAATGWSPTTSGSRRPCSASSATWPPSPWCRPPPPPTTRSPSSPTASSSPTAPAIPPPSPGMSPRSADAGYGRVPVFGICLGHQLLADRPRGHHLQAALRPPRRQPPGARPRHRSGRDHLPEPQLRRGRRLARRLPR